MNIETYLKKLLSDFNGRVLVPKQKGGAFIAELKTRGIHVDCLGFQGFLPWEVFAETLDLLKENNGKALRGNVRVKGAKTHT